MLSQGLMRHHGKEHTRADERMALPDALRKGEEPAADPLRQIVRWAVQELMEAEVAAQIGAGRYERTEERSPQRNGYCPGTWDTRVGTLELQVPKLRQGSDFPSWLEPRRRAEQALVAVVAEAYVQGVSTRKGEALVQALGISGIARSEVSRLAASLDEQVAAFRARRLEAEYPDLWVDARYEHVREAGRVVSLAVVVAHGVRADGVREVLGLEVGLSEDVALWRAFFPSLVGRGLQGVRPLISDAHPSLKQAIREVFVGAAWQRCRVHVHAEPAGPGAQDRRGDGGRHGADSLSATGSGRCPAAIARGLQGLAGEVPARGRAPGGGRRGGVYLLRLPDRASAAAL